MTDRLAPPSNDAVGHFVLRAARLFLVYGASADHVRQRVEAVAAGLGVSANLFISGERLLLSVSSTAGYRTRIGRPIDNMGIDIGRFDALETIVADVLANRVGLAEADRRLDALENAGGSHPGWLVVLAVGGTAASLARLFGAEWAVVAAALLAGVVNTLLRRFFGRRHANPVAAAFVAAFVSGLLGAMALGTASQASPILCLVAAGMILVPGVPLINGIVDLAAGYAGIGLSRLVTATIAILAIGFGLILAAVVIGVALPVNLVNPPIPLWQTFAFAALAAVGYAMLFNVPGQALLACVLCGSLSYGVRAVLERNGLDLATATLLAALLAGLLARSFGKYLKLPWPTFAFAGTVAMIPGSYAFRAAAGGLHIMAQGAASTPALVAETLSLTITSVVMTASVGIGLMLPSVLPRGGFAAAR